MKNLNVKNQEVSVEVSMVRGNGYGQYRIVAECNGEDFTKRFSFHNTDSQMWDDQSSDDFNSSEFEQRLLDLIESDLIDSISELIEE